jgi:hypothetical protein
VGEPAADANGQQGGTSSPAGRTLPVAAVIVLALVGLLLIKIVMRGRGTANDSAEEVIEGLAELVKNA